MDIKKPDLKAILEKLSFLKNNMALLVPIVLALVAALLFVPTTLLSKGLQAKIQTGSIAKGRQLDSLVQNRVVSSEQASIEAENQKKIAEDANEIVLLNRQCAERPLLSYRIFPEPKERSALIFEDFGRAYIAGVDKQMKELRATVPPTEEELQRFQGEQLNRTGIGADRGTMLYEGGGAGPGARGEMGGLYGGMTDMGGPASEIEDAVCMDRAMSAGIYINPTDIAGYEFWTDYKYETDVDEAVETCWYWQLGYWILEDVFDTIKTCNGASTTVMASPVKRLKTLSFAPSMGGGSIGMYGGGESYGGGRGGSVNNVGSGKNIPKYVFSAADAMVTPCTNRYGGDEFHIVHFNLSVVLRSQYVMEFVKALCSAKEQRFKGFVDGQAPEQRLRHNQISVLQIQILPVVKRDMTHRLYRYGDEPVVEIELVCEYLLPKDGYDEVIPPTIKASFEKKSS